MKLRLLAFIVTAFFSTSVQSFTVVNKTLFIIVLSNIGHNIDNTTNTFLAPKIIMPTHFWNSLSSATSFTITIDETSKNISDVDKNTIITFSGGADGVIKIQKSYPESLDGAKNNFSTYCRSVWRKHINWYNDEKE